MLNYNFTNLCVNAQCKTEMKAANLFIEEIKMRTGKEPVLNGQTVPCIKLCHDESISDKDSYIIEQTGNTMTISANGIRGLIFGYSYFLRKTRYIDGKIELIEDISGQYSPYKKIRGHQLGYRPTPNTYDKWDLKDYERYYRDMMYFGCNVCEHIPGGGENHERNSIMKYSMDELAFLTAQTADELDMDISLWYPNIPEESEEEALKSREEFLSKIKRVNYFFPPGSDPGDMPAKEFIERCIKLSKILKKYHPNAEMWPSAQAPHLQPGWGDEFIKALDNAPDGIDGVIMGPNHAMNIDELRRRVDKKYPIRMYQDITHNVRCEYPVNFLNDDWHYALASVLGRESINPRPQEFRTLHKLTAPYCVGSISYSEGVSDDINKFVWSNMDYFKDVDLRETLLDYSRVFFWGVDEEKIADIIFALELSWVGDPSENSSIQYCLTELEKILKKHKSLKENWRFVSLIFLARCNMLVRKRTIFELDLIKKAKILLRKNDLNGAKKILLTPSLDDYNHLRENIFSDAAKLYELIGMQLDVENFHAKSWERGAVLETLDQPITDCQWLVRCIDYALSLPTEKTEQFIADLLSRNEVNEDEMYFSFALHGFDVLGVGRQDGEFYMNFQGDNPNINNATIPMSMLKVYDHFRFKCRIAGLNADSDYKLKIVFKPKNYENIYKHISDEKLKELKPCLTIKVNSKNIYSGFPFIGEKDLEFDKQFLAPPFESVSYIIPKDYIENGCAYIEIEEPLVGFEIAEFWIKH